MSKCIAVALACLCLCAPARSQDLVWDPTEIARLSQQAARISIAFSSLVELGQQFSSLSSALGAAGPRTALASVAMSGLSALADPALAAPRNGGSPAIDGLSVVFLANKDLSMAGDRARLLSGQAAASIDLRGDVQANSAIGLAILAEAISIESLLALRLQSHAMPRRQP